MARFQIDGIGNLTKEDAAPTLAPVNVYATHLEKIDESGNLTASDEITPQPNVLDRFASYTYSASVYLMSTLQYERLLRRIRKKHQRIFFAVSKWWCAHQQRWISGQGSGEVGGQNPNAEGLDDLGVDDYGRNPAFPQDFYIDSITIDNALPGKSKHNSPHGH
jgi:hypothetical protein